MSIIEGLIARIEVLEQLVLKPESESAEDSAPAPTAPAPTPTVDQEPDRVRQITRKASNAE